MKRECEVFWSHQSRKQVDSIIRYLESNFSEREVNKFLLSLMSFEKTVALFPELYPRSPELSGCRKAVLSKRISIFYNKEAEGIYIFTVWDNRQNPDTLSEIIYKE